MSVLKGKWIIFALSFALDTLRDFVLASVLLCKAVLPRRVWFLIYLLQVLR